MKILLKSKLVLSVFILLLSSCGEVRFSGSDNSSAPENPGGGGGGTVAPTQTRDVVYNGTVDPKTSKVDILLVIDDSNSMLEDNKKLASRLSGFVTTLQNSQIDWQMCITLTRQMTIDKNLYWGASVNWSDYTPTTGGYKWLLKSGTSNLTTVFNSTIDRIGAGWAGTDDERGIMAAYWHVGNSQYNKCYRDDAAMSVIVISDEDVRSVGGDSSLEYYKGEYKALDAADLPENFVAQVKNVLGDQKRFTVNSIIVKDDDVGCMQSQDNAGSKSHYGKKYEELSTLTGGGVGSICDSDFTANLNYFKDVIQNSLASVPLECAPVGGNVSVSITPSMGNVVSSVQGMNLIFTPEITAGHTVEIKYKCAGPIPSKVRNPSSEKPVGFLAKVQGMFTALLGWVKGLF